MPPILPSMVETCRNHPNHFSHAAGVISQPNLSISWVIFSCAKMWDDMIYFGCTALQGFVNCERSVYIYIWIIYESYGILFVSGFKWVNYIYDIIWSLHSQSFQIYRQREIIHCSPPSQGFAKSIPKDSLMGWAKRQRPDFGNSWKFPIADSDILDQPGTWNVLGLPHLWKHHETPA